MHSLICVARKARSQGNVEIEPMALLPSQFPSRFLSWTTNNR
jgi:hypothetical protein